jgi:hypothetical protein
MLPPLLLSALAARRAPTWVTTACLKLSAPEPPFVEVKLAQRRIKNSTPRIVDPQPSTSPLLIMMSKSIKRPVLAKTQRI